MLALLFFIVSLYVCAVVVRAWRNRRRTIQVDLGDNVDELRANKKKYQLALKELRIQNSEAAAAGQAARAAWRGKRVRSTAKGFAGSMIRSSNVFAGRALDTSLNHVSRERGSIRQQIVLCERIINRIDAVLLEYERDAVRPKKRRGKPTK